MHGADPRLGLQTVWPCVVGARCSAAPGVLLVTARTGEGAENEWPSELGVRRRRASGCIKSERMCLCNPICS